MRFLLHVWCLALKQLTIQAFAAFKLLSCYAIILLLLKQVSADRDGLA